MIVSMGLCIALGVIICVAQACIGKVGVLASLRSFADGEGTVQVVASSLPSLTKTPASTQSDIFRLLAPLLLSLNSRG